MTEPANDFWRDLRIARGDLMLAAQACRERAYAPYSKFRVGAALLMANGGIVTGCNVENASYGLSICAERAAACAAVAAGGQAPLAVAVAGDPAVFCPPCGACRQFLAELNPQMEVLLMDGEVLRVFSLDELLPHRFGLQERS